MLRVLWEQNEKRASLDDIGALNLSGMVKLVTWMDLDMGTVPRCEIYV